MALIGSISIKLGVDRSKLDSGLASSSKAVQSWASSFPSTSKLAKGFVQMGAGLRDLGTLFKGAAGGVASGLKPVTSILTGWAQHIGTEIADPIRSSFAYTFGGLASKVGPALGKVGSAVSGGFDKALTAMASSRFAPFALALGTVGKGFATASIGAVKFGLGLGKTGVSYAFAAIGKLGSLLPSIGSAFLSVGAAALKFAAVGGVIAGVMGVKAASAAAHLNETINTTEQVFGSSAAGIVKNAEMMNSAFATNRKEFLEGANALGGQFQGVGYAEKDAAALSVQLLKLAADATASRDPLGGFAESLGKIRSGLSGEAEPLKAWGISLDEQAVKAQALTMGLVKQGQELDNAAKVQARMAIITQGLAKDQGALAREATGPAAQMSEFWGRVQTLMETVGQSIAPTLGAALVQVNTGIVALGLAWDASKESVFGWATGTLESIGLADKGALTLRGSIGFLADAWGIVKGATAGFFSYFEAGISRVSGWIAKIFEGLSHIGGGEWAKGWQKSIEEYSASAKTVSQDLGQSMQDAFSGKNLASTQVDKFFGEAAKKIADARAAASQPSLEAIGAPKASAVVGKAKSAKDTLVGAMTLGSKEAASTILLIRAGSTGKEGTQANTKRSADLLAENNKIQRDLLKAMRNRADGLEILNF